MLVKVQPLVLAGCVILFAAALIMASRLFSETRKVIRDLEAAKTALSVVPAVDIRDGLSLEILEQIRSSCEALSGAPKDWWGRIESRIEAYGAQDDRETWFLTEAPSSFLSFDNTVGSALSRSLYAATPGIITASGLMLTFVAILLALIDVRYDKSNTAEPISGMETLINGLSSKFLSSIVALLVSIVFTILEKRRLSTVQIQYRAFLKAIEEHIPVISNARILLDIRKATMNQAVSVSNISSSVIDRFIGAFNATVVPGVAQGVADSLQAEFRPTMQVMTQTLDGLNIAISSIEKGKQESITAELRGLLTSLETSLSNSLESMGKSFHHALSSAASQEFGNVQATMEGTRALLENMNTRFSELQQAFGTVVERAERSTIDQLKAGEDNAAALRNLMEGLMVQMQKAQDESLAAVRGQLLLVVTDLADKVGGLSADMARTAKSVTSNSQTVAEGLIQKSSELSQVTTKEINRLFEKIQAGADDFNRAARALADARNQVLDTIAQNATAIKRMDDASKSVRTYSEALAGGGQKLVETVEQQRALTRDMMMTAASIKEIHTQQQKVGTEFQKLFEQTRATIAEIDQRFPKILGELNKGLDTYHRSVENNFTELVKISNELIPSVSRALNEQVDNLIEPLEEFTEAVKRSNGRIK